MDLVGASALHVFWTCPCYTTHPDEWIQRSNKWVTVAKRKAAACPAVWLRACPLKQPAPALSGPVGQVLTAGALARRIDSPRLQAPADSVPPALAAIAPWLTGDGPIAPAHGGIGYITGVDGAGGPHGTDPMLRRSAWGVVHLQMLANSADDDPFLELDTSEFGRQVAQVGRAILQQYVTAGGVAPPFNAVGAAAGPVMGERQTVPVADA